MKTTILTFYVLITTLTGCSDDTGFSPTLPPLPKQEPIPLAAILMATF